MTAHISAAEYHSLVAKTRRNKFNAVPAFRCGLCGSEHVIRFDSKAEARRWDVLSAMQKRGEISDLRRQVPYRIVAADKTVSTYLLDFEYRNRAGIMRREDVKGGRATHTALSKLKIKLVEAQHGITVELVR